MRHDEHRDVLRSVPDGSAVAAAAPETTGPASIISASSSSPSCAPVSPSAVAVSASAGRDVANIAFGFVLDASSDGLSVLVWQRVPRCE